MRAVETSRCLEKKLALFGFEIFDLVAIFITLSVLDLLFGESRYALLEVWIPTALMALALHYGKKGKPDKYLVHRLKYLTSPARYQ
jgi:hypothetical protein